jgi:predicted nucleic acid-binding protein
MRSLRLLIDTSVLLDLVLTREPWFTQARPMWDARNAAQIECCLAASVLTDLFYICRQQIGLSAAKSAVGMCLGRFTILPIDRTIVETAYKPSRHGFRR